MTDVEKDVKGQFAKSVGDRKTIGVASAKPTVVTGSEDATEHKTPPGKKPVTDWDINYDPSDMNGGETRLVETSPQSLDDFQREQWWGGKACLPRATHATPSFIMGVHLLPRPFSFEDLAVRVRDVLDLFPE
jgi:hypothetical protein